VTARVCVCEPRSIPDGEGGCVRCGKSLTRSRPSTKPRKVPKADVRRFQRDEEAERQEWVDHDPGLAQLALVLAGHEAGPEKRRK
jgi:hypothetical protein